ncbi:hypothetical protein PINS_up002695 [Pythium insidiosum]|nr:hypothetical protein PINS_up002695 [Pythium insidiosum]
MLQRAGLRLPAARRRRLPPAALSRRAFFAFANPLSNPDALIKSHRETKVVPFSPEEMYDVVADVDKYHEFLPFCVDSRVLRRPNDNVMEAVLRIGFKVFTEAYTSRVIMKRPEKIVIRSIESPTFKRIESEWHFRRLPTPNTCEVDFRVTFEVASFLHANAIQLFFDDVAVTQLNAFIGRTAKLQSLRARSSRASPPVSPTSTATAPQVTTPTTTTTTTTTTALSGAIPSKSDHLSPAAHKAASIIRDGVWSQDYDRLQAAFTKYADDSQQLYFGGFVKACRELGCVYEDLKHVGENSALAGAIFTSFETSTSPKDWLNLEEFAVGVYLMTKGTVEEKAHTLFHIIDTSGDGKISRDELTTAMERRIRTVRKIFPKLLSDQVAIQLKNENVTSSTAVADEAMSQGLKAIEELMEEIEKDIPLAVNQIFLEADLDQDDFITEDEWLFAWQAHPEFVELMTVDGMKKVAQWASVVQPHDDDGHGSNTHGGVDTRLTHVD